MNKWFYFNLLLILFVLYKVIFGSHLLVSFIGGLGLLFVLFNWTRHAMFSTIRSDIPRIKKIKYAKLSKRVLPIHKWTGMSAFIILYTKKLYIKKNKKYNYHYLSYFFLFILICFFISVFFFFIYHSYLEIFFYVFIFCIIKFFSVFFFLIILTIECAHV